MLDRVKQFIYRALSARISPLAYLTAYVSWVIGFCFLFLDFLPDVQHTLLHQYGILGQPRVWGGGLLLFSTTLLAGMQLRSRAFCKVGSMGNFFLWIFASILYLRHEFWYAFLSFALFHVLCQGYFYLVSSLDSLWEQRVQ